MFKLENTFVKQGLGRLVDPSDVERVLSWFILAARSARGIGFGAGVSAGWSTDARKVAVNTISASKWSPLTAAAAPKVPPFTVFNQFSKRSSLKSWPGPLTAKAKWPWCSDTCQIQSSNEFGGNLIFASSRLKVRTAIWQRCHLRKSPYNDLKLKQSQLQPEDTFQTQLKTMQNEASTQQANADM